VAATQPAKISCDSLVHKCRVGLTWSRLAISITFLDRRSKTLNEWDIGEEEGVGEDSVISSTGDRPITYRGGTDLSSSRSSFLTGDDTGSSSLTEPSWSLRCGDFGHIKHTRRSEIGLWDSENV
jgi:hypothetical protein